jgi:transcriptional regulator with XRE-family HTH domain
MDWGMNVKELRSKFGLSQQQLANLTGIPKGRINAWEQKGIKPKYDDMMVLEKAAAILEKQVSQELDGSNGKQTAAGTDEMYEGIKKIIEGAIDYVLVPKSILMENYRLLPVEQLVKDKVQLEKDKAQIEKERSQIEYDRQVMISMDSREKAYIQNINDLTGEFIRSLNTLIQTISKI